MVRPARLALLAVVLAVLVALPSAGRPVLAASAMQGANDGLQPDNVNNTFHIFGRDTGNPCWGHFNNTDDESANNGYGEESKSSGKLDVEWVCRMDPILADDFALEKDQNIRVHVVVEMWGDFENGQGNCQNDCENLNITLMRGGREAITREFVGLSEGENTIDWDIPVTEDLVPWNRSDDSPGLKFTWVGYARSGLFGAIGGTDAQFRIYYTDDTHTEADSTAYLNGTMTMPILNDTAAGAILGDDEVVEEETPGFGAVAAAGGLMAAAWIRPSRDEDE